MVTFAERMTKVRRSYTRLLILLEDDNRGRLVMAEIAHVAAHLAENVQAIDGQLARAAWRIDAHRRAAVSDDAEHTAPSA